MAGFGILPALFCLLVGQRLYTPAVLMLWCAVQQAFTSEQVEALAEDRRIREQEAQAASHALQQQLQAVLGRLHISEERLRTATRDQILGAHPLICASLLGWC